MNIEPVNHVAGGSGSTSAGLRNWLDTKKKRVNSIYSHSTSYKKPRNPKVGISVIDSSAGLLGLANIGDVDDKFLKSWDSKIKSKVSSIDSLLDLENMKNTVAEEISYPNLDISVIDDIKNDIMFRKMCTCTYVLDLSPKTPLFDVLSGNENMVALLSPKFKDSNQLPSIKSRVSNKRNFEPVKSFTLDIELLALPGKSVSNKLIAIKKIFYRVDGFGEVLTLSKFPRIVRASFTSEFSINKTKKLAICEKIIVNNDLRKVNNHSNQKVIIKEISVDLFRSAIESVFAKFGKIQALVKFELSEVASSDSVQVALAIKDKQFWVFRDQHKTLLYTLPVGITAYNLSGLLDSYDGKTCFIGHNSSFYVHDKCVVICFADETSKLAAIRSVSQVVTDQDRVCLAGIYKKKQASIARLISFGGKTWAQVAGELLADQVSGILVKLGSLELVLLAAASDVSPPKVSVTVAPGLDSDMVLDGELTVSISSPLVVNNTATTISPSSSKVLTTKVGGLESKMVALEVLVEFVLEKLDHLCSVWKIATCNIRDMNNSVKQYDIICWHKESNNLISIVTEIKLKGKICPWIMNKFNGFQVFTSGLNSGHMGFGIVIVMDISLTRHECKISEVPGRLLSIKLLFKNKLSVSILGLYAGASSVAWFFQAGKINSLIAKTVNKSSFIVLDDATSVNAEMFANEFATTVKLSDLDVMYAEEACVKAAINKRIESFESDKNHTIRSVLECPFHKVVLDYLVPLEYVFNDAFSGVMCPVGVDKLLGMVSNFPEDKAAGLSGISNEL
ncbi:hypothetical protein G9A89_012111 [Geosiphon pyriformis]|nr:hypothetical protein G9A89_012111 [Geosiphon pyriformis]